MEVKVDRQNVYRRECGKMGTTKGRNIFKRATPVAKEKYASKVRM